MLDKTTSGAIPDNGADIGTPLTLHREEICWLASMSADEREAVIAPLFGWLAFGEWNPPTSGRTRVAFDTIANKHAQAICQHRNNKARQKARANKRWLKNAVAMPTTTNTTTNTLKKTNTKTDTESESDISHGASESKPESVFISPSEMARGVASLPEIDPWSMPEDEVRCGTTSAAALLRIAFGPGGWRTAVEQVGEDCVRDLFLTFRSEIKAGECPDNAAAAFTERLKHDLGVDFDAGKGAA